MAHGHKRRPRIWRRWRAAVWKIITDGIFAYYDTERSDPMTTSTPIASNTEDAPSEQQAHYHYGSGSRGCLYDYGPEISTSIEEAVDDLATVFDLEDGQRHELTERRFIALGGGYGADYAEITPCNEPECPDYLYYVRQFAGQPISKKGA